MRRWKLFWEKIRGRADLRAVFKMGAWSFFIVLGAGLTIKFFVLDSVKINGIQMEPAIMAGDRLLIFKTPYVIPGGFIRPQKPVVATLPDKNANTILRIAATSGDIISIDEGQFYRNGQPIERFHKDIEEFSVISAEFSPSDFMPPFKIPEPGDSITFAELSMRDLIFAYSILRQERSKIRLKPFVVMDENLIDDYVIKDFILYNGPIDEIPDSLTADWFFWDRLQEFFSITAGGEKGAQLAFSVFKGNREITGFTVKKQYAFLIGDNWNGAKDSRYFGPVIINNVQGRVFMALWGFKVDEYGKRKLNWGRIFRFIK
jgi:signal peptidase I